MVLTQEQIGLGIRGCLPFRCSDMHQGSCNLKCMQQFMNGCKALYKLYIVIHFAPALLFRTQQLRQQFFSELLSVLIKLGRSLMFVGVGPAIGRRIICLVTKLGGSDGIFLPISWGIASVCIFLQSHSRRGEISLYFATKTWEVLQRLLERRGYWIRIKNFNVYMFAFAMGVIGYYYQQEPETIRGSYLSIMAKLLGPI